MTALVCSSCQAPTPLRVPSCAYCNAKLVWGALEPLVVGDSIATFDLAKPDLSRWEGVLATQVHSHVEFSRPADTGYRDVFEPRLCDASVTVVGASLDPFGSIGVIARLVSEGKWSSYYAALVDAGTRTVLLRRVLAAPTGVEQVDIVSPEVNAAVHGIGELNRVELRCRDALLEVYVNDTLAITAVDAHFGYGQFGWYIRTKAGGSAQLRIDRASLAHLA